ncbi:MAG: Gfo/Idh/MocA family protein [Solirubrobacterales bacterium]
MENRVGWGSLGAARIAGGAVLPAIAASSNGRVVAIASRDPERAKQMADGFDGARAADSYDALLADPEVDAVYIPLVNSDHKLWTLRALEAGKHVLCEKPLAMNAAEAEEMAAAAKRSGKHLMEAAMYRFHPRTRAFIETLVDPIYVQARFGFTLNNKTDYRLESAMGGGALLDIGFYVVSIARWILGEPSDVLARSRLRNGTDMTTSALLRFPGDQTASVWASFESPEDQELTVVTRQGAYRLGRPFNWSDEVNQYQLMVESFAGSVLHDTPVAIPVSESIANMKVLDRIKEAAKS